MVVLLYLALSLISVLLRFLEFHLATHTVNVELVDLRRMVLIVHFLLRPLSDILIVRLNLVLEIIMGRGSSMKVLFI